ncbi:gluconokinase [Evansella tamaricis]|uniref:Gluconokinase n=1 Tax=Evansella tamaricis TaxID=2069301 RepID=A0ABS6JN20_9BACI|nr:gluconokinase [Evansella tamaricis]MBU9714933.1 gluconokinase [Evansella tamaricis]
MRIKYVIGLDIGTTSAKAVVFTTDGQVVSEHEIGYPTLHPHPSWVEQDPYVIEQAAISSIKIAIGKTTIQPGEILSLGISAAMHSLICIDDSGRALTNSITWADRRSMDQVQELKGSTLGNNIYLSTGTPIHPMSPLLKLMWMKDTKNKAYEKSRKFLSIKEFLTYRWFKETVIDFSIAAATGMFNIHTLDWDDEALEMAGVTREQLSDPVPPTYVFKKIDAQVAKRMGIPTDLPVAIGASDGPLANLGMGAIESGDSVITIGTSGAIRQMASSPKTDSKQEVFCYSVMEDLWIFGGPTNNGGNVLHWLKEVLGEKEAAEAKEVQKEVYELLTNLCQEIPPGSNGLLFLPFLYGERAPHWDGNAKGAYIGLTSEHGKAHLLRAGLEGVIYNLYQISEALNRLAGPTKTLYASGGFSRSPLWLEILADVFGQDIHIPENHQSSAWGAAWVSLLATKEVDSLQGIKDCIPMGKVIAPNPIHHETYCQYYTVYRDLYRSLENSFHQLGAIGSTGQSG